MLAAPQFNKHPNKTLMAVISIDGNPSSAKPIVHCPGIYEVSHFNFDYLMYTGTYDQYPQLGDDDSFAPLGVCDSICQFFATALGTMVKESQCRFCVAFTHVSKMNQPSYGGWRWHKWGTYIGEGDPQHEYLYDEDGFDNGVYCYHVYALKA